MAYQGVYPPAHSSTYVKATNYYSTYYPYLATDPALSLTGTSSGTTWVHDLFNAGSVKFNIDLGSVETVERLYVENYHNQGTATGYGVKLLRIYGAADDANGATAFANLDPANLTDLTLVHASQITVAEHVASDVVDPEYFVLDTPSSYRYYVLVITERIDGTAGGALRHIELQVNYTEGNLDVGSIAVNGEAGGVAELDVGSVTLSGSVIYGDLDVGGITISGAPGGVGNLITATGGITISGEGDTSVLSEISGTLPYYFETSGTSIVLNTHAVVAVAGTLSYSLESGVSIDKFEIAGKLPYSLEGSITARVDSPLELTGTLPYSLSGSIDLAQHADLSIAGNLGYSLTGGISLDSGTLNVIGGTLPYTLSGTMNAQDRHSVELDGYIPYTLNGSIEASSGADCYGVLAHTRP